jgi:hypothetical protein
MSEHFLGSNKAFEILANLSEESSETNAILLPSKWRKETEGGWRMDVDITVQDELDEENDVENVIMSENEDESDSESSTPDNI